jgi:predicted DNA-binding transcriptional regulator AlpA
MSQLYLTALQAAEYLSLSTSYLAKLRMDALPQAGPKFLRVGPRAIWYRRKDLDEWMMSKSDAKQSTRWGAR